MTSITLIVTGANIRAEVNGPLTSGMVGIPVTIHYDDVWNGLTKNLVCRCGKWGPDRGETRTVLSIDQTATVAHEVMKADKRLYLGVEGYSTDGKLVIPTAWADCGVILPGANAGADPTTDPELCVWAQLQAEIKQIKQDTVTEEDVADVVSAYLEENAGKILDSSLAASGLSDTAKTLLISILRSGVYSTDQSDNITALEAELLSGDEDTRNHSYIADVTTAATCTTAGVKTYTCSCGDSYTENIPATGHNYVDGVCSVCGAVDPDYNPDEDTVTYTITNALTNVTSSNAAGSVAENAGYSATLTAADGYELDTVTVTMGGVDISSTAYNSGVVTIEAVTGNVVITATATEIAAADEKHYMSEYESQLGYYNVNTGAIMSASSTYYTEDIPVEAGRTIEIYATATVTVAFKTSDKTVITPVTTVDGATTNNQIASINVPDTAAYMSIMYGAGKENVAYWMYLD